MTIQRVTFPFYLTIAFITLCATQHTWLVMNMSVESVLYLEAFTFCKLSLLGFILSKIRLTSNLEGS
jgi:hypothetical protein